ncbi:MAG: hypothetical protein OXU45_03590 [Candidatus Melainabacteria bacterium]|nr:hypothetical protein [Candidatus Melainabacteria bacterium]
MSPLQLPADRRIAGLRWAQELDSQDQNLVHCNVSVLTESGEPKTKPRVEFDLSSAAPEAGAQATERKLKSISFNHVSYFDKQDETKI